MKPLEDRKAAFKKFLDVTFQYFTVIIWKVIGEALAVYDDKIENVKDEQLTLHMNSVINEAFKDWINPIASSIAVSISLNIDLVEEGEQFFGEVLRQVEEKLRNT